MTQLLSLVILQLFNNQDFTDIYTLRETRINPLKSKKREREEKVGGSVRHYI
jgi:hypothetical protein